MDHKKFKPFRNHEHEKDLKDRYEQVNKALKATTNPNPNWYESVTGKNEKPVI